MKRRKFTDPKEMYRNLVLFWYLLLVIAAQTALLIMGINTILALILSLTLSFPVALLLPLLDNRYRKLKKKEE